MQRPPQSPLPRRTFLRGSGAALVLPVLGAMTPAFGKAAKPAPSPRRMLAVCCNLGILPKRFFPTEDGWGRIPAMGYGEVVASKHPCCSSGMACRDLRCGNVGAVLRTASADIDQHAMAACSADQLLQERELRTFCVAGAHNEYLFHYSHIRGRML